MEWNIVPSLFGLLVIVNIYKLIVVSKVSGNKIDFVANDSASTLIIGIDSYNDNGNDSDKKLLHNNNNSILQQPMLRNVIPDSYFCGQILGGHYMFGSASSYCGGFTVRDCSAQCFYRNFTFFQCEGFLCHCYS